MQDCMEAVIVLIVACTGLANGIFLGQLRRRVDNLEKSPVEVKIRLNGDALMAVLQNARRVS